MSSRAPLGELQDHGEFCRRHIGPDDAEMATMLAALGVDSVDALLDAAVPESIRRRDPLELPSGRTERDVLTEVRELAGRNRVVTSLIGMGYHGTITPPVIQRNLLENPAWYTAYTPYQPEISQGRLEALLNFQTMVADLAGMDLANASMLDEATAAAEAMTMCRRLAKTDSDTFVIDPDTHPQTIAVMRTRAEPVGIDLVVGRPDDVEDCFGALLSYPGSSGAVRSLDDFTDRVHALGGLTVVAADLLALVLLTPPGQRGADIVVGSAQRFGVPMGFGGPHAAFLATRGRVLPARCPAAWSASARTAPAGPLSGWPCRPGSSTSAARRPPATSAPPRCCWRTSPAPTRCGTGRRVWHGSPSGCTGSPRSWPPGFSRAVTSWSTIHGSTPCRCASPAAPTRSWPRPASAGSTCGRSTPTPWASASTRPPHRRWSRPSGRRSVWKPGARTSSTTTAPDGLPPGARRTDEILTHPVFNRYHSEHELLRYLRRLADRDLALDRTMIPLGSCTMKLNAAAEMLPITWPELAHIHPFAPAEQAEGYHALIRGLEHMLMAITGYDAVSVQPNAGSQGELAGLLAIRAYHRSRGDDQRTVCLIPSSAHGTNAASAVMAGMGVVVVACDEGGNVDLTDLRTKAEAAGPRLAAALVTYPSTHGVFEEGITELCAIVHDLGGQVYVDGANLNALVGIAQPGRFGADVSHLNLHKTFCIPHGGGGPGVGPIGVRAHLAPFLPGHPLAPPGADAVGPVSAAPFGSAGILAISWVYIALMGADGLRHATEVAVTNANYVAARLRPHFPVLFTGRGGFVAHECILDLRPLTRSTGVTVDDVAKRLMDYGFHAPTMSFPVAGTLMVEPTESENSARAGPVLRCHDRHSG